MPEFKIKKIKEHLFINIHNLLGEFKRFDPHIEIADAWKRLQSGNFVKQDLELLEHKYFESKFENLYQTDYSTAHNSETMLHHNNPVRCNMKILLLIITSLSVASYAGVSQLNLQYQLLEKSSDGTLGVAAIDTESHESLNYNANKRFPFCSTFKFVLVAAILRKSQIDYGLLEKKLHYTKQDLVGWSPITRKHLSQGMTVKQLCKAAITQSDNAAANLLMKLLGGPKAVTWFARTIRDKKFNLVRWETALNTAIPGDPRDTTTPLSMTNSLKAIVLGNILAPQNKHLIKSWLLENATGAKRMRSGTPRGWLVGDKTGTGDYGTTNDIGVVWPPTCNPIIISLYFTQYKKNAAPDEKILAKATQFVLKSLSKKDACLRKSL